MKLGMLKSWVIEASEFPMGLGPYDLVTFCGCLIIISFQQHCSFCALSLETQWNFIGSLTDHMPMRTLLNLTDFLRDSDQNIDLLRLLNHFTCKSVAHAPVVFDKYS